MNVKFSSLLFSYDLRLLPGLKRLGRETAHSASIITDI